MEMDVLRMLVRKAGNIHGDKSIPLWQTAAVDAIRRGAAYVLLPIGMIAAIVIVSNLLTSWAYQQSGELMEVKRETQQLQRETMNCASRFPNWKHRNEFIRPRRSDWAW